VQEKNADFAEYSLLGEAGFHIVSLVNGRTSGDCLAIRKAALVDTAKDQC